ncbi:MFS transporter [Lentibacter algarum]|uniref:MFS transporter n=1 Tax=Lentibacter algarum TaxID=576131 RepID=UPI001C0A0264|nr:MFS transporter [Lentibacter algarum]MBU2982555.1 MFS transporter [Lentibacter algarum]
MNRPERASHNTAVPVSFVPSDKRHFVLIAAVLASALGFIDSSVLAIALPAMRDSLGAGLAEAQWFHNGYMLTLSACILAGGALADKFGLSRSFRSGITLFVVASCICATAANPTQMIIARLLQGLGAALMVPGSLAVISRAYPPEERGKAIGLWAACSALTTALGPALGGLALSTGGPEAWRLIFAINLPLGGLAVWLVWQFTTDTKRDTTQQVDAIGACLATLSLFLIALGLTQESLLLTLSGLPVAAAFIFHERRCAAPMLDLTLFTNRDFSAVNLATFLLYFGFNGVLFYLPMTLITGWGQSPLLTSLTFAPLTVFIALLSAKAGALAGSIGPRPLISLGAIVASGGFALLSVAITTEQFFTGVLPATSVIGFGVGCVVAPLSTAVMGAAPDSHAGSASGINNAVARMAGLFGVAALGLAAQAGYLGVSEGSFGAISSVASHKPAMISGFQAVTLLAALSAFLGALVAWFGLSPQASSSASQ